jgi:hypothetical protein
MLIMKKVLLLVAFLAPFIAKSQCTTTNATGCVCADGSSNDCDLLPDITISWFALQTYMSGPTEYSQTGNGVNDGRLRVTGSTPNIGYGSFTVRGEDNAGTKYFVCGTDTTTFDPGICADGNSPQQLLIQRIYHKNGNTMTYTDRWAGAMTYHPTHGHNHVNDWAYMTLRLEDPTEPDPRNWPIVGNGAKLGFCLMDYGTCPYYDGHCRDVNTVNNQGTNLNTSGVFPNYGLGGGAYNCSPVEQGISVGYTDIYSEQLDGMWINIPPGTCNGDYWIVAEADRNNDFLESNEDNNYTAIPFTLTQQVASNPVANISSTLGSSICSGDNVTLTATTGLSYLWSNGATTQSITVSASGTYTCDVTMYCGTPTASFTLSVDPIAGAPTSVSADQVICSGQSTTLSATGNSIHWFNSSMVEVGIGPTFTTPSLTGTTSFYAQDFSSVTPIADQVGPNDNSIGGGGILNDNSRYLIFDVAQPIIINSVKVFSTTTAGNRTIMVLDQGGNMVQGGTFFIDNTGEQIIPVNFSVPAGSDYEMRVTSTIVDLYRNNAGVTYPYVDGTGTVTITGSQAGAGFYYYFYDWQISVEGSQCPGPQAMITVNVDPCLGVDENTDMLSRMNIYPNPNDGLFTFNLDMPGTADFVLTVTDILGKNIYSKSQERITGMYSENIDLKGVDAGIYFATIQIEGKTYVKKVVIE